MKSKPLAIVSQGSQVALAGVDTLYLNYFADIPGHVLSSIRYHKELLQNQSRFALEIPYTLGGIDGIRFNVRRTGQQFWQYVLVSGDIKLLVSTRDGKSNIPSIRLEIGSISCNQGVMEKVKMVDSLLDFLGVDVLRRTVARVDLFADIRGSIDTLGFGDLNKSVSRAVDKAVYFRGTAVTGVQYGSGQIVARIYNKRLEMEVKQALSKSDFFQRLWKVDDDITRVEFQLRSKALKSFGGVGFEQVMLKAGDIWKYLTEDWLRYCEYVNRRSKKQAVARVTAFWSAVVGAFVGIKALRNKISADYNPKALLKQAVGCVSSILARTGLDVDDLFGQAAFFRDLVQREMVELFGSPKHKDRYLTRQRDFISIF